MMGVLTCIAAAIGYVLVPNLPAKATFLNAEEHQLIRDRIDLDRRDFVEEKLTVRLALHHLASIRIWA